MCFYYVGRFDGYSMTKFLDIGEKTRLDKFNQTQLASIVCINVQEFTIFETITSSRADQPGNYQKLPSDSLNGLRLKHFSSKSVYHSQ